MAFKTAIQGVCVVPEASKGDKWPGVFACRPEVGDIVRSLQKNELKVVAVKHAFDEDVKDGETWHVPFLIVILE